MVKLIGLHISLMTNYPGRLRTRLSLRPESADKITEVPVSGVRETKHGKKSPRISGASIMEPEAYRRMTDSSAAVRGLVDRAKLTGDAAQRKKAVESLAERLDCLSEIASETKFPDVARRAIELMRNHEDKEGAKTRLRYIQTVSQLPEIKKFVSGILEEMETLERMRHW